MLRQHSELFISISEGRAIPARDVVPHMTRAREVEEQVKQVTDKADRLERESQGVLAMLQHAYQTLDTLPPLAPEGEEGVGEVSGVSDDGFVRECLVEVERALAAIGEHVGMDSAQGVEGGQQGEAESLRQALAASQEELVARHEVARQLLRDKRALREEVAAREAEGECVADLLGESMAVLDRVGAEVLALEWEAPRGDVSSSDGFEDRVRERVQELVKEEAERAVEWEMKAADEAERAAALEAKVEEEAKRAAEWEEKAKAAERDLAEWREKAEQATAVSGGRNLEETLGELEAELKRAVASSEEWEKRSREAEARVDGLEDRLEKEGKRAADLEVQLLEARKLEGELRDEAQRVGERVAQLEVATSEEAERAAGLEMQLRRGEERMAELEERMREEQSKAGENEALEVELAEHREAVERLTDSLQTSAVKFGALEMRLEGLVPLRSEVEKLRMHKEEILQMACRMEGLAALEMREAEERAGVLVDAGDAWVCQLMEVLSEWVGKSADVRDDEKRMGAEEK
eukprot:Sspe_Gene.38841::Locus_18731_Transcript_1_1_Confidence_1.000_Length_1705::g.38841::m.38841